MTTTLDKLVRLQEKAKLPEVFPLVQEYETIKTAYHVDSKPIEVYLTSKYLHGETRGFLPWYIDHQDIFDKKYFNARVQKFQPFDPHRFP